MLLARSWCRRYGSQHQHNPLIGSSSTIGLVVKVVAENDALSVAQMKFEPLIWFERPSKVLVLLSRQIQPLLSEIHRYAE